MPTFRHPGDTTTLPVLVGLCNQGKKRPAGCHGRTALSDLYTARHSASVCPSDPPTLHPASRYSPPYTNYIAPKRDEPADRKAGGKTQRCVMADHAAQPVLPSCHAVERTTRRGLTRNFVMNVHLRGCRIQDQTAFQDRQPCQMDCDVGVLPSRQRNENVFVRQSLYRRLKSWGFQL